MQALRRFLLPDGALIVAALVITRVPTARGAVEGIATGLLVAAVAAGVLLGVRFHRGRQTTRTVGGASGESRWAPARHA